MVVWSTSRTLNSNAVGSNPAGATKPEDIMMQKIINGSAGAMIDVDEAIDACIAKSTILIAPSIVLSRACVDVEYSPKIVELFNYMSMMLHVHDGIGLAAPQVGLSINYVVVKHKDQILSMLNPQIKLTSVDSVQFNEGCLSVPGYKFPVNRPSEVSLTYIDSDGTEQERWFYDITARCIQHEIDHIHGITIINSGNINRAHRKACEATLRKLKRKRK